MGVGDSWGTREELLHPRDKNGRFRNTWKMAAGVVEKILATLSAFNPKTFTSDEEAASYVHGQARSNRFLTNRGSAIESFLKGYSKVNADLRAGRPNADAATIKKGMSPLPDDLILSRVVGPEAFGLDPQSVGQVEELTGKLISDKGFSSTNIGTPMAHQPGAITMSIVAPKGTKALLPSTSRPTREVILDTDQPYRITKVDPDGQGGFYVYAVATGESHGETPVNIRHALPSKGVEEAPPGGGEVPGGAGAGGGTEVPQVPGGGGQAAGGPGQRNEGHVGIVGQPGGGEQGTGQVAPEIPATPEEGPDTRSTFRDAFEKAAIKVPTVGNRRNEFQEAYLGITSGKKTPQEAVRDLDNKITLNKRIMESDKADGTDSGPLGEDIKRQQALSDLIKEHFNFTGRKTQKAPEKKTAAAEKAVEKVTPPPKKLGVAAGQPVKTEKIRKATGSRKKTPLSDELNGAYTRTNLVQLREIADRNGIKVPGDKKTKRDVFEHIVAELKRKESGGPEVPEVPEKKVAKKAVAPVKKGVPEKKVPAIKKVPTPPEKTVEKDQEINVAAAKVSNGWLAKAGIEESSLTDSQKVKLSSISGAVARKTITQAEAARRLRGDDATLNKIADGIPGGRVAKKVTVPEVTGDIDKMTVAQLREEAKRRGIKVPSSARRKADIIDFLHGRKTVEGSEEKAPEAPGDIDKMTVAQLRAEAKRQGKTIPGGVTRKADIVEVLKGTQHKKESEAIRKGAAKPSSTEIKARLDKVTSREDADKYLRDLDLSAAEQRQLAKDLNIAIPAGSNKEATHKLLVHWGAGRRIDSERIRKPGGTGRGLDKIAKKAVGEEVKAPETSKPLWGTLKTHGFKPGDVFMYHGRDRRGPKPEGRKAQLVIRNGIYYLKDPDTDSLFEQFGPAMRMWVDRLPAAKKPTNTDKGLVHMSLPELRQKAKDEGIDIPKNLRKKDDIVAHLADKLAEKEIAARKPEVKEPEVKAPEVKKPERLIPGMAAGKTNTGRVKEGETILVTKNASGEWVPSTGKTKATQLTVTRKDIVQIGRRRGYQIHGTGPNGEEIAVRPGPSHQTFWKVDKTPEVKAPEKKPVAKKAVPEKKVGPTAAEIKVTQQEQRRKDLEARKAERERLAAEKKAATEKAVAERQRLAREKVEARQKEVAERRAERQRIAAKDAEDRRIAKEARMRLAGVRAAEKKKAAAEKLIAEKKQVQLSEREQKIQKEMDRLRSYLGFTETGLTRDQLHISAQRNGVTIPPEMRTKKEIVEFLLHAIAEKQVEREEDRVKVPALIRALRREGIILPQGYKYKSSRQIETYAAGIRQNVVDQGIDPKKFKPQGRLVRPVSLAGDGRYTQADWDKVLPRNTDPNHPVLISGFRTADGYELMDGVAVRRDGITYLIETTAEGVNNPYHVAQITKEFEDFHKSFPDRDKFQHQYGWFLGPNPGDEYWQKKFNNKNHVALASAGGGRVSMWGQGGPRYKNQSPAVFNDTLNHEFGHNVDKDHYISDQPRWADIGSNDMFLVERMAKQNKLVAVPLADIHPLSLKRDRDRAYPDGISEYGKSSRAEDFAESMAYYMLNVRVAQNQETGESFFFEDLFPSRTAFFDALFPNLAKGRTERIRLERERLKAMLAARRP